MEYSITADRMLKYACSKAELSCIIGNLFVELSAPCGKCEADGVIISGIDYNGEAATLVIVEHGFLFDGNPAAITTIREGRCIYNE